MLRLYKLKEFDWISQEGMEVLLPQDIVVRIQCFAEGVNTFVEGYGCNLYFYKDENFVCKKIANYNKCSKEIVEKNIKTILDEFMDIYKPTRRNTYRFADRFDECEIWSDVGGGYYEDLTFDWKTNKGIEVEFPHSIINVVCFEKGVNTDFDGYGCNLHILNKKRKRLKLFKTISNYNKCSKEIVERNISHMLRSLYEWDICNTREVKQHNILFNYFSDDEYTAIRNLYLSKFYSCPTKK